jgi:hypothetical protein
MTGRIRNILIAITVAGLVSCVEQPKDLTKEQLQAAKPYISTVKPNMDSTLNINFEDHIILLGYDVAPKGPVKPGSTITVTWYWQCKKKLDDGWLLFTHVEDAKTSPRINADNEGVIRRNYPPGKWKAGEFIKDVQRISIPADWDSPTVTFYIGVWFGPHRLQVKTGAKDKENRARALVLQTTVKAKPDIHSKYQVFKAEDEITIDGKLDEKTWASATEVVMVDPVTGGKMFPKTTFRAAWDEKKFYVAFTAEDDHLECTYKKRDDPIYDQDAVEIFLDPDGDQKNYYELQVSPTGLIFDSFLPEYRKNQNDWSSTMEVAVQTDGTLNNKEDVDKSWTAEFAIPVEDLKVEAIKAGDTWKANFFRLDSAKAGRKGYAWSAPRNNDFHNLERFGEILFAEKKAGEAPPEAAAPPEAPPMEPPVAGGPGKPIFKKLAMPTKLMPPTKTKAQPKGKKGEGEAKH